MRLTALPSLKLTGRLFLIMLATCLLLVVGIATVFVAAVKMLVEVMHSASAGNKAANDSHFS